MPARRLLISLAVMMMVMALVVAVAPPPRNGPAVRETEVRGQAPVPTPARIVEERIFVTDEDADPVRVVTEVGELVRLEVHATDYDSVEVQGLDLFQALSPEAPATFEILIDREGSYPIVLLESEREIGSLDVNPKG